MLGHDRSQEGWQGAPGAQRNGENEAQVSSLAQFFFLLVQFWMQGEVGWNTQKKQLKTPKHNTENNVLEHNFYATYSIPTKKIN